MKKLCLFVLFAFVSFPVFAETPAEYCAAEAREAGIEDSEELNNYISDCMEQVNAETNEANETASEESEVANAQ